MPKIKIKALQCILNDEVDKDEVYLKYNGKKIWPLGMYKQINSGEKLKVDKSFDHSEGTIEIELWDFDYLSKNDHLGTFKMKPDGDRGTFTASMQLHRADSTASYILEWEAED